MSFSGDIKQELASQYTKRRHCQIAELAAMTSFIGRVVTTDAGGCSIFVQTENQQAAKKYCMLIKKCFHISPDVAVRAQGAHFKNRSYRICIHDAFSVLQASKLIGDDRRLHPPDALVHPLLIQKSCCMRAFLRGAFLSAGSMSDPSKSYHLEFVCDNAKKSAQLAALLNRFDLHAKTVLRKRQHIVYIKEGEQIVTLLNLMEAHRSLMEFENIRIRRELANQINRQTNCDVANSQKTISASARQREDIQLISRTKGLSSLSPQLYEIAALRLAYPDISIKELGELLTPPIGKSGVNHRLRKINQIANKIRGIE